jgi:hypothetical protein
MLRLEDLQSGVRITGIIPNTVVTVVDAKWIGSTAVELIYRDANGRIGSQPLFRDNEPSLELVAAGRPWSCDGDGTVFRLVSEAYRIHLAWLFDPYVAITTSLIEPLPHQIAAVYDDMLPRQPLRFLLADDPGAGKTIMAGLLLKELIVRGDLERCLIVSPGSLTEQWQDELWEKFGIDFEVLTHDMIAASRTANPFAHKHYLIARMDQLSRNDDLQEKLTAAPNGT